MSTFHVARRDSNASIEVLTSSDVFTLAAEFATRNMAVATAMTLAGRVEFAIFATSYFLTEIPLMLRPRCRPTMAASRPDQNY